MAGPLIGTPARDVTSTSFRSDDLNDELPDEEGSFMPPPGHDLLTKGTRSSGSLRTPRHALQLLPNGNAQRPGKAEFTPLLKSVTKNNMSKRIPNSARRRGHGASETPGLARVDESALSVSSASRHDLSRVPQDFSSSPASTPLAQLPSKNGKVVNDGNMMTLREQENIIDKIEKENFGLKMKIHFLEENLSKRGGEFNQAALKENTDLKVNRITMQRELHKFKKTLAQAEKDAELYRKQLEDYRERVRQKKVDETVRVELASMKSELQQKEEELESVREKYERVRSAKDDEAQRLRDEVSDLQADLRERDRQLEDREDEIDSLKANAKQGSNSTAELEEELESAREEIEGLRHDLDEAKSAKHEAKEQQESAEDRKRRAEQELYELQDEVANKSILPHGLSKQLEERAAKFEDDYLELQERFKVLQQSLEEKSQSERSLQERLRHAEREGSSDARHLQQELEAVQLKSESFERKYNNMAKQVEAVNKELLIKTDEKDLLQSRHDALTAESAQLQQELSRARKSVATLESSIEQERQRAAQNDSQLRLQHRNELDQHIDQIDTLHREASARDEQYATEVENWAAEKRVIESAKDKAEEKASGLQRTVDKLNDAQGTLSSKELRMQQALESEKQRHSQEEKVLNKQIDELNQDLLTKRTTAEEHRTELSNAREELRISLREQALLKEKVTELEDEIEVLQADIEQEHDLAQQIQQKSSSASDAQFIKLKKEKADLQEELVNVRLQLDASKRSILSLETERNELEARLSKPQLQQDDTFDMQQDKREFRREKQRLEKELDVIKRERDNLMQTNKDLEEELDAEVDRANAKEHKLNIELDQLRNKQLTASDNNGKELASAKNKIHRLESRIRDLEDTLASHSRNISSPDVDVSGLRLDLEEARKSETAATKREADLKSNNRDLKMKVNDLEKQLHEARLSELKSRSPASSVSSGNFRELKELRQEVFGVRAQVKILQDENQILKRSARRRSQDDTQQAVIQAKLDSKVDQIENLANKLEDQNQLVDTLRKDLARIRTERDEARKAAKHSRSHDESVDLQSEIKRLRAERDDARNTTLQIAGRSKEALAIKSELFRLRTERGKANLRADSIEKELDVVQSRYETLLEKLTSGPARSSSTTEKELRGLMKEVLWLKAKLRREQRLRQDLAWTKTYLENGEQMRVQCNQVDLRILREMGVDVERRKHETKLTPIQKLRAGVFCVIAASRLTRMGDQWRGVKEIGEALAAKKSAQLGRGTFREV